jgi:hypothetical protein
MKALQMISMSGYLVRSVAQFGVGAAGFDPL